MIKLLKQIVASFNLTDVQTEALEALILLEDVNVSPTASDKGLNIRGIQVFNESQLSSIPEYVAFEKSLEGSNINLLVNQGKGYDNPMVSVVASTSTGQSKEDKQSIFA